jgi:SAM-dependent methyltransferase
MKKVCTVICPVCAGDLSYVTEKQPGFWICGECHYSIEGSSCYLGFEIDSNNQTAQHYSDQWGKEKGFLDFVQKQPQVKKIMPSARLGWEELFSRLRDEVIDKDLYIYDAACGFGGIANELINNRTCRNMHYVGADIHGELADIVNKIPYFSDCGILMRWDMVRQIPVREKFDYVLCRASLHHTPNPRESFNALCAALKPGGTIAISVYKKKGLCREACDDALRNVISRMPNSQAYQVCRQLTLLGKALQQIKENIVLTEDLPLIGIAKGEYNVQELIYYHLIKCFNNDDFGEKYSTLVNYDWYHPQYAYRYTLDEVVSWFSENGIELNDTISIEAQHYLVGKKYN